VLLYEPGATPLDVRFRIFRTDVRVHPLFWLIMAMLGWNHFVRPELKDNGLLEFVLWIFCAFLSILLHELGHVWMGRVFGSDGYILLHGMGGLAIGSSNVPQPWQRILVMAAGPGIQLILYALLVGLVLSGTLPVEFTVWRGPVLRFPTDTPLQVMVSMLLFINILWPLLNLLPIWPLDGGQITREVCQMISPRSGTVTALWISVIVAGVLAINAFVVEMGKGELIPQVGRYFGGLFMAIFFAMFAYGSWQALQEETASRRRFWDDRMPWER
jgi:Zn-dependent protease